MVNVSSALNSLYAVRAATSGTFEFKTVFVSFQLHYNYILYSLVRMVSTVEFELLVRIVPDYELVQKRYTKLAHFFVEPFVKSIDHLYLEVEVQATKRMEL